MISTMAFNPSKKQVLSAAACLVGALLWVATQSTSEDFFNHRRLDISFHISQPIQRDVSPTYDTEQLQFMSSPCRPESDGYFGSTSGTPLEIQYGFEMETEDEDNVDSLLDEIQEQIVDVVLAAAFPNLCGYRRRQERARHLSVRGLTNHESELKAKPRTTGFKFGMDLEERSDVCAPLVDPTNLCGVYKNIIQIYGRHLSDVGGSMLMVVKEALKGEQERLVSNGLVRLTIIEDLTHQMGDYGPPPSGIHALSFAAKAAIVIVIIALLAGTATFAVYLYLEQKAHRQERPYMQRGDKKISSNSTVGCEEASQISETVGLRDGTAVILEGGRPVVIEFDKVAKRQQKDAIEEERSECGSTLYSKSVGSASIDYVPRALRGSVMSDEECKEPEGHRMGEGSIGSDYIQPADRMAQSMASLSEYTEHTAKIDLKGKGELI